MVAQIKLIYTSILLVTRLCSFLYQQDTHNIMVVLWCNAASSMQRDPYMATVIIIAQHDASKQAIDCLIATFVNQLVS